MLKNYRNELLGIAAALSLISYGVYVFAAEKPKAKPIVVEAKKVEPAKKATLTPSKKKEAATPAEPKKDPNRKKPTLKKKYADKNNK